MHKLDRVPPTLRSVRDSGSYPSARPVPNRNEQPETRVLRLRMIVLDVEIAQNEQQTGLTLQHARKLVNDLAKCGVIDATCDEPLSRVG